MKDPAFLFYSSDFITGVSDLTMEERGQYITLLCLHHQKGRLTKKNIDIAVPNATADVLAKFKVDEKGFYYNTRLEFESNKRAEHAEKQRERAINGWKKRKSHDNTTADAAALPLENENEIVNRNIIIDYLNNVCKTEFRKSSKKTIAVINARFKDDFTIEDFKIVIDFKFKQWGNDKQMKEYLRPETLFGTKFESYLQAAKLENIQQPKKMVR